VLSCTWHSDGSLMLQSLWVDLDGRCTVVVTHIPVPQAALRAQESIYQYLYLYTLLGLHLSQLTKATQPLELECVAHWKGIQTRPRLQIHR
jgi:hypothetical protein